MNGTLLKIYHLPYPIRRALRYGSMFMEAYYVKTQYAGLTCTVTPSQSNQFRHNSIKSDKYRNSGKKYISKYEIRNTKYQKRNTKYEISRQHLILYV